jgi:hypothetical protein
MARSRGTSGGPARGFANKALGNGDDHYGQSQRAGGSGRTNEPDPSSGSTNPTVAEASDGASLLRPARLKSCILFEPWLILAFFAMPVRTWPSTAELGPSRDR